MPTNRVIPTRPRINPLSLKATVRSLSAKVLNTGMTIWNRATARNRANTDIRIDSPRNCLISCRRFAPTTLRRPTSLARPADRAVAIFIKLMQAINSMKSATEERI